MAVIKNSCWELPTRGKQQKNVVGNSRQQEEQQKTAVGNS